MEQIFDIDLWGLVEPTAFAIVMVLVEVIKQTDRKLTPAATGKRKSDAGRIAWAYPILPFIVAGLWFALLNSNTLVIDIGIHGAAVHLSLQLGVKAVELMSKKGA